MGIFDWFFGRGNKDTKIILKVSMLGSFIQESVGRKGRYREAQPILGDIVSLIECIKDNTQSIDSEKEASETPERLLNIIKTSKPAFIKTMIESARGLEKIPEERDIREYQRKLSDFLGAAPKAIMGAGRYLHFSHGEKLGEIKKDLKTLLEKKIELDEALKEDAYHKIEADAKSLEESLSKKQALEAEGKNLEEALREKKAVESKLRETHKNIEETDCSKEYIMNKKSLEETAKEKERLENEIHDLVTPIKKTLKTINHNLEKNSTTSISRKDLSAYTDDPVREFKSNDMKKTTEFLSQIKELLRNEAMNLGEDKIKKTNSKIDEILSPETEKKKQRLAQLTQEERRQSERLNQSPYPADKANLERDIEKTARELRQIEDEREKIKKKIRQTGEEIATLKDRLEKELSEIKGEKVTLLDT